MSTEQSDRYDDDFDADDRESEEELGIEVTWPEIAAQAPAGWPITY